MTSLWCAHCGRRVFVNADDGVAYHEATAERECHYWEGSPLARVSVRNMPLTPDHYE